MIIIINISMTIITITIILMIKLMITSSNCAKINPINNPVPLPSLHH
jgi:hypothetical protein